jgi:dimethylargininase
MSERSFRFSHAICRLPSKSLVDGLRAVDTGTPNYNQFIKDHQSYVEALKASGAEVVLLDALEPFPDSVFIEDAALCLREGAIVMRPGAETRLGEADEIEPWLSKIYSKVDRIEGPGFIEGGDILTTENEILVGTSARTNSAGIAELKTLVEPWGYKVREVNTPKEILHFKTDCSLLDSKTILSTSRLASTGCFDGYKVIEVADGEEACANSIRFNDNVIMPSSFLKTQKKLEDCGYQIIPIGNSEAAKLDGGMSCLSLRFSPS